MMISLSAFEGPPRPECACSSLLDELLSGGEGRGADETLAGKIWAHGKAAGGLGK